MMYAHQVIEDLRNTFSEFEKQYPGLNGGPFSFDLSEIINAQKFHTPNPDDLYDILINDNDLRFDDDDFYREYLTEISIDYCFPPYKLCWFDYINYDGIKVGALLREEKPSIYSIFPFHFARYYQKWLLIPVQMFLIVDRSDLHPVSARSSIPFVEGTYTEIKFDGKNEDYSKLWDAAEVDFEELIDDFKYILISLNIKNAPIKQIDPPEKLNIKRLKKGRVPIFTYKILEFEMFKNKNNSSKATGEGTKKRPHLCRRHVRRYTKDGKLFGKYEGLFMIPEHVRGRNRSGIVMKDYLGKLPH